jgi:serine/threonine-protein kinase
LKMVHRDIAAADPPVPTPTGVPVDQGSSGDSIPVNRVLASGLRVLDRLGSTPEGPLYRAEYPNGAEVALVVLHSEAVGGEPSRRERFGRATQIQHPNVAAVYEVGEMEDGSVYVVLEQVVGGPLSDLLAAGHVLALREALDLALQATAGLQAALRAGFVHGNLSPHTILVTRAAYGRPQIKLSGFTLDSAFRQTAAKPPIPGEASTGYASPERIVGHPPDERSEVFSLGAVLHHLLTGMPPDPGHVDSSVPDVARAVLHTALAPAPDRRFQTISELDEALRRVAAVAANPKTAVIHRAILIGAMAAALALVTGGIWLLPGSKWRATSEERPVPVAGTMDPGGVQPGPPTAREAPPKSAPARSPAPAPAAARQDALRTRNGEADSDRAPAGASAHSAPQATRPRSAPTASANAETDGSIETGMVANPPPEQPAPPSIEERAEVYLRIGLDEASQQLGRPVHAIEGMTPSFLGLARSRFPGYTAAGPAVRVVYIGPNGSLILLDQQRVRPGRREPAPTATRWRIGNVMLYLHGEAPPGVLSSFARRVR